MKILHKNREKLAQEQKLANNTRAVLLIFQATDAAGTNTDYAIGHRSGPGGHD